MTTYYIVNDLDLEIMEVSGVLEKSGAYWLIRTAPKRSVAVDGPLFTDREFAEHYLRDLARREKNEAQFALFRAEEDLARATARLAWVKERCADLGLEGKGYA